ncbi:MAG: hypothetical protein JO247_12260, partial [Chloroflexi bacterium]|nr:hypothetical protein [Chloroflexota bacterium]
MEALERILDLRLYMVVAPAGYGKTMLLREFSRLAPAPVAVVNLGPEHANLGLFAQALLDGVRRRYPESGRRALRLLQPALGSDLADEALIALVHEFLAELAQPIIVALDDYHLAESGLASTNISKLIGSLLSNRRLPHVHFVISSRELPTFSYSKLVLEGLVEGIGFEDLAFTSDEVGSYLELVRGHPDGRSEAERYYEQTHGWPAAVTLLTLGGGSLVPLSGPESVRRYLDEEVMPGLPASLREFAIRCSALDSLSVQLCDFALGAEDAHLRLNELQQRSLFIQRAGDDELDPRFQFHSLWRDYLALHLAPEER